MKRPIVTNEQLQQAIDLCKRLPCTGRFKKACEDALKARTKKGKKEMGHA